MLFDRASQVLQSSAGDSSPAFAAVLSYGDCLNSFPFTSKHSETACAGGR